MTTIAHLPFNLFAVFILWGYDPDDASTFAGIPVEDQPSFMLAFQVSVAARAMRLDGRSREEIEQFVVDELDARPTLRRGALDELCGV
ncbi:hypothetical protein [Rhodococcus sp. H29-C3]|uniref:hypothetical protein n=1 Tax=Rhodococcus sp. H29-C3 TaxID=3046307 RepID=UPI0024B87A49|nr:hypothetical protein [Rhodococcus sp. H29-C3]MDJ0359708.1 hypothetical protein [Rhodococcus sp. H29-C3]